MSEEILNKRLEESDNFFDFFYNVQKKSISLDFYESKSFTNEYEKESKLEEINRLEELLGPDRADYWFNTSLRSDASFFPPYEIKEDNCPDIKVYFSKKMCVFLNTKNHKLSFISSDFIPGGYEGEILSRELTGEYSQVSSVSDGGFLITSCFEKQVYGLGVNLSNELCIENWEPQTAKLRLSNTYSQLAKESPIKNVVYQVTPSNEPSILVTLQNNKAIVLGNNQFSQLGILHDKLAVSKGELHPQVNQLEGPVFKTFTACIDYNSPDRVFDFEWVFINTEGVFTQGQSDWKRHKALSRLKAIELWSHPEGQAHYMLAKHPAKKGIQIYVWGTGFFNDKGSLRLPTLTGSTTSFANKHGGVQDLKLGPGGVIFLLTKKGKIGLWGPSDTLKGIVFFKKISRDLTNLAKKSGGLLSFTLFDEDHSLILLMKDGTIWDCRFSPETRKYKFPVRAEHLEKLEIPEASIERPKLLYSVGGQKMLMVSDQAGIWLTSLRLCSAQKIYQISGSFKSIFPDHVMRPHYDSKAICRRFLLKLNKDVNNPHWNKAGVGLFGKVLPTSMRKIRNSFKHLLKEFDLNKIEDIANKEAPRFFQVLLPTLEAAHERTLIEDQKSLSEQHKKYQAWWQGSKGRAGAREIKGMLFESQRDSLDSTQEEERSVWLP